MSIINTYNKLLEEHTLITKTITTIILFGIGDILCQLIEKYYFESITKLNINRMLKMASVGIVLGPYVHLNMCVIIPYFWPDMNNTWDFILSVAYDVVISGGIFNYIFFLFMFVQSIPKEEMNKKTIWSILSDKILIDKFIEVEINDLKIWPFLVAFNFFFIPLKYRVLVDNFFCIFWNIYLSFIENNTSEKIKQIVIRLSTKSKIRKDMSTPLATYSKEDFDIEKEEDIEVIRIKPTKRFSEKFYINSNGLSYGRGSMHSLKFDKKSF